MIPTAWDGRKAVKGNLNPVTLVRIVVTRKTPVQRFTCLPAMKPPATTNPAKIPTRLNTTWINVNVVRPKSIGRSFRWDRDCVVPTYGRAAVTTCAPMGIAYPDGVRYRATARSTPSRIRASRSGDWRASTPPVRTPPSRAATNRYPGVGTVHVTRSVANVTDLSSNPAVARARRHVGALANRLRSGPVGRSGDGTACAVTASSRIFQPESSVGATQTVNPKRPPGASTRRVSAKARSG